MSKVCPGCGIEKSVEEFAKAANRKDGLQVYCKPCHSERRKGNGASKRYYYRNLEASRAKARENYWKTPEEKRAASLARYYENIEDVTVKRKARGLRLKLAAFDAYGGRLCACCGESEIAFLSVDHIDGCGTELRKQQGAGSVFYNWLKKNGYPPGFQILCFNCNLGRRVNGGTCPHKSAVIPDAT